MNIFGEWEYSAEELKQMEKEKKEKEKAEAEAKKLAEEEAARLKAEAEERKAKEKETKEKDEEAKAKKYKFPFLMYFGHEYRDVTGVFEEGKEYSEKQLTKTLIDHGFKDFKYAQEIQWEYFEDENCLYPKFKLGNRG